MPDKRFTSIHKDTDTGVFAPRLAEAVFESRKVKNMKLDMHCHTKEGSLDGKVAIKDYIHKLIELGYDGMLVTDHNSYNGYRAYRDVISKEVPKDFVVLRGIEYDTLDAGHILVIMPESFKLKFLEFRGLKVDLLIDLVHKYGGILGPAHPCGERHLSFARTKAYRRNPDILKKFDFIEGYNSCESKESNENASLLADTYHLVQFGGSDSHRIECVGTAYTELPTRVTSESELIQLVRQHALCTCGGGHYDGTVKQKIGFVNHVLVESFWFYNRFASLFRHRKRALALSRIA